MEAVCGNLLGRVVEVFLVPLVVESCQDPVYHGRVQAGLLGVDVELFHSK